MKEYDAYLFDADGTIMDSWELIYQSFMHMGEVMRADMPDRDVVEGTIGMTLRKSLDVILGEGHPEEYYSRAIAVYVDYMMESYPKFLKTFPGTAETLAELHRRGKKLAVVTSRKRNSLEIFLEFLGLASYFSVLVTPESTERHKPDPQPALLALEQLGVAPERSLFVGDTILDVGCGRSAGMGTALVGWGGDPSGWDVQPEYIVERPGDLLPD